MVEHDKIDDMPVVCNIEDPMPAHMVVDFENRELDNSEGEDTDNNNVNGDVTPFIYSLPTPLTLSIPTNRIDGTEYEPPPGLDQSFNSDTLDGEMMKINCILSKERLKRTKDTVHMQMTKSLQLSKNGEPETGINMTSREPPESTSIIS